MSRSLQRDVDVAVSEVHGQRFDHGGPRSITYATKLPPGSTPSAGIRTRPRCPTIPDFLGGILYAAMVRRRGRSSYARQLLSTFLFAWEVVLGDQLQIDNLRCVFLILIIESYNRKNDSCHD